MVRPTFAKAWALFGYVNAPVAQVGTKIGGKVGDNIAAGIFQNACPIRMSYVLNYSGTPVPKSGYAVSSGADGKWYMYRVNDMMTFLERTFGSPDRTVASPKLADFARGQGIMVIKG